MRYAREYITRFGLTPDQIPENLSMALGTAAVAPIAMARGYAVFANGGYLVDPYLISAIDDRDGKTVYHADPAVVCSHCTEHAVAPTTAADDKAVSLNPIGDAHAGSVDSGPPAWPTRHGACRYSLAMRDTPADRSRSVAS